MHYKDRPQVRLVEDGSSTYTPTTCSRWYDHEWLKADYKPDSSINVVWTPICVVFMEWAVYSSPAISQPSILRPPLIIRPLDLVPKGNFLC